MRTFLFLLLFFLVFALIGYLESSPSEYVTREQVKDYIEHCGIQHPQIVFKQAILETGHFESRLFLDDNNVFGMKLAKNRPTTAIGANKNGSAIYLTWQHSVIDYMIWQQRQYKGGDYYRFLKRVYAEDTIYVRKLKQVR